MSTDVYSSAVLWSAVAAVVVVAAATTVAEQLFVMVAQDYHNQLHIIAGMNLLLTLVFHVIDVVLGVLGVAH